MARILIAEDEMTIAIWLEDLLMEQGHEVVGMAMRLPQAVEMARTLELDFAVLDVNLDGRDSFPIADVLAVRGVPFIFATGYGAAGLKYPHDKRPVIQKPFDAETLRQAIAGVLTPA